MELLEYLQENFPLIGFAVSSIFDLILTILLFKKTGKIKKYDMASHLKEKKIVDGCVPVDEVDMIDKTIAYHQQCVKDLQSVKEERYGGSNSK